jgi:hypothetical protein
MGHRLLGGKTVLFVVDSLWGGSEAVDPPVKFRNSSFLVSKDPVAIR